MPRSSSRPHVPELRVADDERTLLDHGVETPEERIGRRLELGEAMTFIVPG
jgi:hypothetical protein